MRTKITTPIISLWHNNYVKLFFEAGNSFVSISPQLRGFEEYFERIGYQHRFLQLLHKLQRKKYEWIWFQGDRMHQTFKNFWNNSVGCSDAAIITIFILYDIKKIYFEGKG